MADEVVEVTIRPDGAVEMHVDGMAGMACRAETEALVRLLGGDIATDEAQEDGSRRLTLRRSV